MCCFSDEMLLAGAAVLYLTATNNNGFTGKSSLTSFCAECSEKKIRLKHHFLRTERCCESEDRSE